jgi:hypothetical protein
MPDLTITEHYLKILYFCSYIDECICWMLMHFYSILKFPSIHSHHTPRRAHVTQSVQSRRWLCWYHNAHEHAYISTIFTSVLLQLVVRVSIGVATIPNKKDLIPRFEACRGQFFLGGGGGGVAEFDWFVVPMGCMLYVHLEKWWLFLTTSQLQSHPQIRIPARGLGYRVSGRD